MLSVLSIGLFSCASYTEDQENAATDICECINKAVVGDFDIDYYECDVEVKENYDGEVFSDEGYVLALEDKCPDIASKITE